jgi:Outer membrane protein beta-barrel domain
MLMKSKLASFRNRVGVVTALVVASLGLPGPAAAVEHGVYMAADYGNTRFGRGAASFDAQLEPFLEGELCVEMTCSNVIDVSLGTSSLTSKSHGYDVWVGYQFTPWFAVEGSYLILGSTRHHFTGTLDAGDVDEDGDGNVDYTGSQPLQGDTKFRTRGPAVAAVGSVALGKYFSVDARAGLFFADDKLTLRLQYSPPTGDQSLAPYSEAQGKTRIFYGASANFWITDYFGVRAGFTGSSNGSFGHSFRYYYLGIRYSYGY